MINKPQKTHSRQGQCLCGSQDSISLQQADTQPFHNQDKNSHIFILFPYFPFCETKRFTGSFRKIFKKKGYAMQDIFSSRPDLIPEHCKILQIIVTIGVSSCLSCQKRLGSTCRGVRAFGSMSEGLNKE